MEILDISGRARDRNTRVREPIPEEEEIILPDPIIEEPSESEQNTNNNQGIYREELTLSGIFESQGMPIQENTYAMVFFGIVFVFVLFCCGCYMKNKLKVWTPPKWF
jgi:hypothetical protein